MSGRGIARVYVSSTFRDLQRERGLVLEAVERAGAKPASMEYYGADARPALELCVEDVRKSDLYIGILGWRQGYCPGTSDIGITESEYNAAGAKPIPRLVYLTPELEAWAGERDPDTRTIRTFRERVKQEVAAFPFESLEKLALAVSADLSRELGPRVLPAVPNDSVLPYLCDRSDQTTAILDRLTEAKGLPAVCLAHGDRDQSLSRFVDALRECHLGVLVGSKEPAKEYTLRWPTDAPEKVALRMRQGLALELGLDPRSATDESLSDRLAAHPGHVIVSVQVPAEAWSETQQARIESFVNYWRGWPKRTPTRPELVVLWTEYPAIQRGVLSLLGVSSRSERLYQQAVRSVTALKGSLLDPLPPAQSVEESEATEWARREEIRRSAPGRDLSGAVARLYKTRNHIPMEELGPILLELLQNPKLTGAPPVGAPPAHE